MTQPLTHARIGYDSIGPRGTVSASGALAGYPASAAANPLTYSFWSAGLPSTWEVALTAAEECNYFGVAAHTLHSNHVVVAMQALINAAWTTLPALVVFGDVWRFGGDLFGERGAAHGTTVASLRRGIAIDGQPVLTNDVQDSKFGQYSMTVESAVTNLFPENVRTCGDTSQDLTGFNPASTASHSELHAVSGDGSMLIYNGGASGFLDPLGVSISASTLYVVSLKVTTLEDTGGAGGVTLGAFGNVSGALGLETSLDLKAGEWRVVLLAFTTGGSDTAVTFSINTTGGSVWIDELQLETGGFPHVWVNGSRAAGDLEYQPEIVQQIAGACTWNVWFRFGSTNARNRQIVEAEFGGTEQFWIRGLTNGMMQLIRVTSGVPVTDQFAFTADDDWHMLTAVLDPDGATKAALYLDGVLKASSTTNLQPDWQAMTTFTIGNSHGTDALDVGSDGESCIGEVFVLNRAATAAEIRGWHTADSPADELALGLPNHDDDRPIVRLVEAATSNKFRLKFVGQTTPVVGVIYMGKALEMQRALYGGHTPINLARSTVIRPNVSSGGQFVGRSIIRAGSKGSWVWSNLTANWVREYLDPFVDEARTTPFFMLWRPTRFPGEAGYCWTAGDQAPSNMGKAGFMAFSLDAEGLGVE